MHQALQEMFVKNKGTLGVHDGVMEAQADGNLPRGGPVVYDMKPPKGSRLAVKIKGRVVLALKSLGCGSLYTFRSTTLFDGNYLV